MNIKIKEMEYFLNMLQLKLSIEPDFVWKSIFMEIFNSSLIHKKETEYSGFFESTYLIISGISDLPDIEIMKEQVNQIIASCKEMIETANLQYDRKANYYCEVTRGLLLS